MWDKFIPKQIKIFFLTIAICTGQGIQTENRLIYSNAQHFTLSYTNTENVQCPLNQRQRLRWKEWHLFQKLISKESP